MHSGKPAEPPHVEPVQPPGRPVTTYQIRQNEAVGYPHPHPERTAYRFATREIGADLVCKVWPSREALRQTVRMQESRERDLLDWRPVVKFP